MATDSIATIDTLYFTVDDDDKILLLKKDLSPADTIYITGLSNLMFKKVGNTYVIASPFKESNSSNIGYGSISPEYDSPNPKSMRLDEANNLIENMELMLATINWDYECADDPLPDRALLLYENNIDVKASGTLKMPESPASIISWKSLIATNDKLKIPDTFLWPFFTVNDIDSPTKCYGLRYNIAIPLEPTDKLVLVRNFLKETEISQSFKNGDDVHPATENLVNVVDIDIGDRTALFLTAADKLSLAQKDGPSYSYVDSLHTIEDDHRKVFSLYENDQILPSSDTTFFASELIGDKPVLLPISIVCKK